jgi:HSP20 family protein
MRLIKYDNLWNDPFSEFDSLFNRILGDRSMLPNLFNGETDRGFRLDSYAHDDGYEIVAELPGIPKEAIEVKLENAVLTISGEHQTGEGESTRRFRFSRSVTVGDDIAADKVSARLENGLLRVSLPKIEERRPKAITVH